MAESGTGEAQEASLRGAVEEHLGDGQANDLRVSDPRLAPRPRAPGQEIIGKDIKCGEQSVEVGRHTASLVGVALATPDFDARPQVHSPAIAVNSESLI